MQDQDEEALIPRVPGPVLSLRFDGDVLQLSHRNTTVRVFSDPYAWLNHAHYAPAGRYCFNPRLVDRLRLEWFPTVITRYPADSDIDAYVECLGRDLDRNLENLT